MLTLPFNIICGSALGVSQSSAKRNGLLTDLTPVGQAPCPVSINVSRGNLVLQTPWAQARYYDHILPFVFYYNSQHTKASAAWRFAIRGLHQDAHQTQTVTVIEPDGAEVTHTYDEARHAYVAYPAQAGLSVVTLGHFADGPWKRYDTVTGITEYFSAQGLLIAAYDAQGNRVGYTYDAHHRLTHITPASGERYELAYIPTADHGLTITVTVVAGDQSTLLQCHQWDQAGRLVTSAVGDDAAYHCRYHYNGHTTQLIGCTQDDGSALAFIYARLDATARLTQIAVGTGQERVTYGVRLTASDEAVVDFPGQRAVMKLRFNAAHCLLAYAQAVGDNAVVDTYITAAYTYTDDHQLATRTAVDGSVTHYSYDLSTGRVADTTWPDGQRTEALYDPTTGDQLVEAAVVQASPTQSPHVIKTYQVYRTGFLGTFRVLAFQIDAAGCVHQYDHNDQGQPIRERIFTATPYVVEHGLPSLDALTHWTTQQQQTAPHLIQCTEFTYDERGNRRTTIHYAATDSHGNGSPDYPVLRHTQDWTYFGAVTTNTTHLTDTQTVTDTTQYDAQQRRTMHRLGALTDPQCQITTTAYSRQRPETTQVLPNGRRQVTTRNSRGETTAQAQQLITAARITTTTRDPQGLARLITHPNGTRTYQWFDNQHRLRYHVEPLEQGRGRVTEYRYDDGRRVTTTHRYARSIDVTTWDNQPRYPALAALQAVLVSESATDRVSHVIRDSRQRPQYEIDVTAQGSFVTEQAYDKRNNPRCKTQYATPMTADIIDALLQGRAPTLPTDPLNDRVWYTFYDARQQRLAEIDPAGYATRYVYNLPGQRVQRIRYAQPLAPDQRTHAPTAEPTARDAVDSFVYDGRNLCVAQQDPEGFAQRSGYYQNGELYTRTQLITPQSANQAATHPHTADEDHTTTHLLDTIGRAHQTLYPNAKREVVTRDVMDNLVSRDVCDDDGQDPARTHLKRYDDWSQCLQEAPPRVAQLLANIAADPHLSDHAKQQLQASAWQQLARTHTYDPHGVHQTTRDELGHNTYFYTDVGGRLRFEIAANGRIIEYHYTPFDERIETRHYAKPCPSTLLVTLTGGVLTPTVTEQLQALRQETQDRIERQAVDQRGLVISTTDPAGFTTTYKHNAFRQVMEIREPVADQTQLNVTTHIYEPRGLLIRKTVQAGKLTLTEQFKYAHFLGKRTQYEDALKRTTCWLYNKRGEEMVRIEPGNRRTAVERNAMGRIIKRRNPAGHKTRYRFVRRARQRIIERLDPQEHVLDSRHEVSNAFGELCETTDTLGNRTQHAYGVDGQRETTTDPLGYQSRTGFNIKGLPETYTNKREIITQLRYNNVDQVTLTTADPDGLHLITQHQHNTLGQEVMTIDPHQVKTQHVVTPRGDVTHTIVDPRTPDNPNGLHLTTQRDVAASGAITRIEHGDHSNPHQRTLVKQHDAFGRGNGQILAPDTLHIQTQKQLDVVGQARIVIDPQHNSTYQWFDDSGNKRLVIDAEGRIHETRFSPTHKPTLTMDYAQYIDLTTIGAQLSLEAIVALITPLMQDPDNQRRYTYYDERDRPVFEINSLGAIVGHTFNTNDEVIATCHYATAYPTVDQLDHITAADIATFCQAYPPAHNRTTYRIVDARHQPRFVIDAEGYIHESVFDAEGNTITTIDYARRVDDPQALSQLTPDQVRAHLTQTAEDQWTYYVFDSRPTQALPRYTVHPNRSVVEYQHDTQGNLTRTIHYAQPIAVPTDYAALLVQLHQLTPNAEQDRIESATFDNAQRKCTETDALGYTEQHVYDALSQEIQTIKKNGAQWQQLFDDAGRQTDKISPVVAVTRVQLSTTDNETPALTHETVQRSVRTHYEMDQLSRQIAIIHDYQGEDERRVDFQYNLLKQITGLRQAAVDIDDPSAQASMTQPPVKRVDTEVKTIYDAKKNKVVTINEAGVAQFWIYNSENQCRFHLREDGGLTEYRYSVFGEEISKRHYTVPVTDLDLATYRTRGLTLAELLPHVPDSQQSQGITRTFDKLKREIQTQWDSVPYYLPSTEGTPLTGEARPTLRYQFDAFGNERVRAQWIAPADQATRDDPWQTLPPSQWVGQWAVHTAWFDTMNNPRLEIDPEGYVTYTERDGFSDPCAIRSYEQALNSRPTLDDTVETILQQTQAVPHQQRLYTTFIHDKIGQTLTETTHEVTFHEPVVAPGQPPHYETRTGQAVSRYYRYNPLHKRTLIEEADGSQTRFLFDPRNNLYAEIKCARTQQIDPQGGIQTLTPYERHLINAHGHEIGTLAFAQSAQRDDSGHFVQPVSSTDDRITLLWQDHRGLTKVKQSPNQAITFATYTRTRQPARAYHHTTNQTPTTPVDTPVTQWQSQLHLDETVYHYTANDDVTQQIMKRDGVIQRTVVTVYDLLRRPIQEGPDAETTAMYRAYDDAGHLRASNHKQGVPTLYGRDLRGYETLTLHFPTQPADYDLRTLDVKQILTLFSDPWRENIIDKVRTETRYNGNGYPVDMYLPAREADHPALLETLPLTLQTHQHYQAQSTCLSLSGLYPANAQLVPVSLCLTPLPAAHVPQTSTPMTLPIRYVGARFGADTRHLPSGHYHVRVDYEIPSPYLTATQRHYVSESIIQLHNEPQHGSHGMVVEPPRDETGLLRIHGCVTGITHVRVYTYQHHRDAAHAKTTFHCHIPVTNTVTEHAIIMNLEDVPTGHYVLGYWINDREVAHSLPLTVTTAQPAAGPWLHAQDGLWFISGLASVQAAPKGLRYLDTSLDRAAHWRTLATDTYTWLDNDTLVARAPQLAPGIYLCEWGDLTLTYFKHDDGHVAPPFSAQTRLAHAEQPAPIIRPHHHFGRNRYGRLVTHRTPTDNTFSYTYDNRDQLISAQSDAITVLDDQGQPHTAPLTYDYLVDRRARRLGFKNPRGYVELALPNEANTVWVHYLGDGTREFLHQLDIFNQAITTWNVYNRPTTKTYNASSAMTRQRWPSGRTQAMTVNEANLTTVEQDFLGNYRVQQFDVFRQSCNQFLPLGQCDQQTTRVWQGTRLTITRHTLAGTLVDIYDWFGRLLSHQDVSGAVVTYRLNGMGQPHTQTSEGGDHGTYRPFAPFEPPPGGSDIPVPGQHLELIYRGGLLHTVIDHALGYHHAIRYDDANRIVGYQLTYLATGAIVRDARSAFNAVNGLMSTLDNQVRFIMHTNASGQVAAVEGSASSELVHAPTPETPPRVEVTQSHYHRYNGANLPTLVAGVRQDQSIAITPSQGAELSYYGTYLNTKTWYESGELLAAQYGYTLDDEWDAEQGHTGDVTGPMHYEIQRALVNGHYAVTRTGNATQAVTLDGNANGWTQSSSQQEGSALPTTVDNTALTAWGEPAAQKITYKPKKPMPGGTKHGYYDIGTEDYVARTYVATLVDDTPQLSTVSGVRRLYKEHIHHSNGHHTRRRSEHPSDSQIGLARRHYGPNGELLEVRDSSTSNGRFVNDLHRQTVVKFLGGVGWMRAITTPDGASLIGSCHFEGLDVGLRVKINPALPIPSQLKILLEPVTTYGESFPPRLPQTRQAVMATGSTWHSVVSTFYGGPEQVGLVARHNGLDPLQTPERGTPVDLPPVTEKNFFAPPADTSAVAQFTQQLQGALYPVMVFALQPARHHHHHHHHHWWSKLLRIVEIAVEVVISVVLTYYLGPVGAGLADIINQGMEMVLQQRQRFSVGELALSVASSAAAKGIDAAFKGAQTVGNSAIAASGASTVTREAATQAAHINWAQVGRQVEQGLLTAASHEVLKASLGLGPVRIESILTTGLTYGVDSRLTQGTLARHPDALRVLDAGVQTVSTAVLRHQPLTAEQLAQAATGALAAAETQTRLDKREQPQHQEPQLHRQAQHAQRVQALRHNTTRRNALQVSYRQAQAAGSAAPRLRFASSSTQSSDLLDETLTSLQQRLEAPFDTAWVEVPSWKGLATAFAQDTYSGPYTYLGSQALASTVHTPREDTFIHAFTSHFKAHVGETLKEYIDIARSTWQTPYQSSAVKHAYASAGETLVRWNAKFKADAKQFGDGVAYSVLHMNDTMTTLGAMTAGDWGAALGDGGLGNVAILVPGVGEIAGLGQLGVNALRTGAQVGVRAGVRVVDSAVSVGRSRFAWFGGRTLGAEGSSSIYRQERMLQKGVGYNLSPESWFNNYSSIGREGIFVTDYRAIGEILGPVRANTQYEVSFFSRGNTISYYKASRLEKSLGLEPGTLKEGFRFTRVSRIGEMHPRSPLEGNRFFMGPGIGLPGGGPELVVDSIPTKPWPVWRYK